LKGRKEKDNIDLGFILLGMVVIFCHSSKALEKIIEQVSSRKKP
jgi:hypothetical protein